MCSESPALPSPAEPTVVPARRDPVFWAVSLLAGLLLFWSLGGRCLWQDEAETALLGLSVLRTGVPTAYDGKNLISQEAGNEFGRDYVWRWSPWVQFYLVAPSLALFGRTTWAARLPFALLGLLTVPGTYLLARRLFNSVGVARLSALFLALSVPFLLHARQARWYAVFYLLTALLLLAVLRVRRGQRFGVAAVVLCATLLFYTNYFTAIGILFALTVAAPVCYPEWPFLRRLAVAGLLTGVLALPGMAYFHVLGKGQPFNAEWFLVQLEDYATWFVSYLLPLPMLLLLVAVWLKSRHTPDAAASAGAGVPFLLAFCLVYLLYVPLAPWANMRYLTVLLPVTAVLLGWVTCRVFRRSRLGGVVLLLVLTCTDAIYQFPLDYFAVRATRRADRFPSVGSACLSLCGYVYEATHPVEDPEWVLTEHLRAHARPDDVVLITYGDLTLQFYTELRVVGGLEGRPVPLDPDWIIVRGAWVNARPGGDVQVIQEVCRHINLYDYVPSACRCSEMMLGNDPDPPHHVFRAPAEAPPVTVLHKRSRSGGLGG
jgi:hypothetical protein